ncbi:MAG: EFR1 family ferrodoxin [Exilispira sp.]
MKALILYFSATGNTYYITKKIKNKLSSIIDIDMVSIEKCKVNDLYQYDILFFGFPVYETDSPVLVQNYIKDLPVVSNKGLFLFCTHGGFPGNAIRKNFNRMIGKGYILLGFLSIGMMDSGALAFMSEKSFIVKYVKNRDYNKLKALDRFISKTEKILLEIKNRENLKNILNNKIIPPYNLGGFLLDWLWKFIYNLWEKNLKKKFWVDNKCTLCKLCISICPVKNISIENEKITFGKFCFLCFRCIHQCPFKAIQIGKNTIGKFRWKGPYDCFIMKKQ